MKKTSPKRLPTLVRPHATMLALAGVALLLALVVLLPTAFRRSTTWGSETAVKICDLPAQMRYPDGSDYFDPSPGDTFAFTGQGCAFSRIGPSAEAQYYPDEATYRQVAASGAVLEADRIGLPVHPALAPYGVEITGGGVAGLSCCRYYANLLGRSYGPYHKVWEAQASSDHAHGAVAGADDNPSGTAEGPYVSVDGQKGKRYSVVYHIEFLDSPLRVQYYACDLNACYVVTRAKAI